MQIKIQTLMVAIQCVAAQSDTIDKLLNNKNKPDNAAELEQLLLMYDLAADDLEEKYKEDLKLYIYQHIMI